MALTPAEQARLRADIAADPTLGQLPHTSASADEICAAYNATATPLYWVYKTSLSKEEIVGVTSVEGTAFIWAGNGFIGRSNGELVAWQELFMGDRGPGVCNPSLTNVRQAFSDIFSGVGNAASNRAHLANVWRRTATRLEQLFAGQPGNGTTGTPATMTVIGPLTLAEADTVWSD